MKCGHDLILQIARYAQPHCLCRPGCDTSSLSNGKPPGNVQHQSGAECRQQPDRSRRPATRHLRSEKHLNHRRADSLFRIRSSIASVGNCNGLSVDALHAVARCVVIPRCAHSRFVPRYRRGLDRKRFVFARSMSSSPRPLNTALIM